MNEDRSRIIDKAENVAKSYYQDLASFEEEQAKEANECVKELLNKISAVESAIESINRSTQCHQKILNAIENIEDVKYKEFSKAIEKYRIY